MVIEATELFYTKSRVYTKYAYTDNTLEMLILYFHGYFLMHSSKTVFGG